MKPRLLILSDLWGKRNAQWLESYTKLLQHDFDLQFYDCCELGELDLSDPSEESLHKQFVNGGIARATRKLLELEKEEVHILAFSLGGAIAWNYGLHAGNIVSLHAISSTRLRYEGNKPGGEIQLYFGSLDEYRPNKAWFDKMRLDCKLEAGKKHDYYREVECAQLLCASIVGSSDRKRLQHK